MVTSSNFKGFAIIVKLQDDITKMIKIPINNKSFVRIFLGLVLAVILLFTVILSVSGCSKGFGNSTKVKVVTTSNIVGDWVTEIGKDRVECFSLMPIGSDPHTYQPGAADVGRVSEAGIIFSVGLNLEGTWLSQLIKNASTDPSRVTALGEYIDPLPAVPYETGTETLDPHFWWDPSRVKLAVDKIVEKLIAADPGSSGFYQENATLYKNTLDNLDKSIVDKTGLIPESNRKIVSSHETMQYFAQRYGYVAVGSIFPGISTDREPTAAELAALTAKIKELGVSTIFTETSVNDRLSLAIAQETGAKVIKLYTDSLGTKTNHADTYIAMMDTDMDAIFNALK
jgi:ABC-type Zn uptake system ZnuABC Zn-binding protein ZnuA